MQKCLSAHTWLVGVRVRVTWFTEHIMEHMNYTCGCWVSLCTHPNPTRVIFLSEVLSVVMTSDHKGFEHWSHITFIPQSLPRWTRTARTAAPSPPATDSSLHQLSTSEAGGAARWISFSLASGTPWGWATSGGFLICAIRVEEVSVLPLLLYALLFQTPVVKKKKWQTAKEIIFDWTLKSKKNVNVNKCSKQQ